LRSPASPLRRHLLGLVVGGVLVALPTAAQSLDAEPAIGQITACTARTGLEAVAALRTLPPGVETIDVKSIFDNLPIGTPVKLALYRPFVKNEMDYRIVIQVSGADPDKPDTKGGDVALLQAPRVWAIAATRDSGGTDFTGDKQTEKTLLNFTAPSFARAFWTPANIFVVGCKPGEASPGLVAALATRTTRSDFCTILAVFAVVLFYVLIASATFLHRKRNRSSTAAPNPSDPGHLPTGNKYLSAWHCLDPVVLTAGANGQGNAAKLQILFFSLIVFELLSYIWMRTGRLSDLSQTVLLLLGIAGLGAAAAGGTDIAKGRLDFGNWAWLINRGWLPQGGLGEITRARWADIVTTDGEFNVYRFQMIIFSALVGVSLLTTGLSDLATFTIPDALLSILGLSQAVFVVGKLVAPPACSDLDKQVTVLRGLESKLREAALGRAATPPADLDELRRRVGNDQYDAYLEAARTTRTMFEATLGVKVADDKLPPAVPLAQNDPARAWAA
jgi:hypothetical protein